MANKGHEISESAMANVWSTVFSGAPITPEQNFFELGGDSILAMMLMIHVEEAFDVYCDSGLLFDAPTVQAFTQRVRELQAEDAAGFPEG